MRLTCFCVQNNANVDFTQSTDDDPLIDGPLISQDVLESVIKREFRKLPTHWAVGVLSFLHVSIKQFSLHLLENDNYIKLKI